MELRAFEDFLDERGIAYKYSGQSIVFKECPACGSDSWKVHFYKDRTDEHRPFTGKCFGGKCGETFNSAYYLIQLGIPREEVDAIHGRTPEANLKNMLPDLPVLSDQPKEVEEKKPIEPIDISHFFEFKDWPDHPVVQYATKRGLPKELWPFVRINDADNSVVFLCYDGDDVVGYQERFIKPFDPHMKTKTSFGFKVSEFIMELPNPGKKILVCEGPFTAVAAWVFGYHAICLFGSAMGIDQMEKVIYTAKRNKQPIGMAVENDEAGLKAFDKLAKYLFWKNIPVFKVTSDENDLNDTLQSGKTPVELNIDDTWNPVLPTVDAFKDFL